MMFSNYRFPETATWHPQVIGKDYETLRYSVNKVTFECAEHTIRGKSQTQIIDGVSGSGASVALRTNHLMAREFEVDDTIEYKGETYHIEKLEELRSNAYLGAKEYVIYCR